MVDNTAPFVNHCLQITICILDIQMPGPSSAAQLPIIDIVQPSSKLQKSIASTKSMKRKATTLTKRIRVYKFREKQLKSRVQKAKKLQNNYEFQKKLQRMSKEAATFIQCQMRESGKRKKGRRFTTSEKIFSLSLYKQGPKAYRYCRNIFALPSPATLSKLLQQLPLKIGNYCNYYLYRVTLFPNQTHNIKKKLQCNFYTAI